MLSAWTPSGGAPGMMFRIEGSANIIALRTAANVVSILRMPRDSRTPIEIPVQPITAIAV